MTTDNKKNKVENINTWISDLNSDAKAAVSVDCVIFGYDEKELNVLLIDCNMPPHLGKKSLIGDLVKSHETLDEAGLRILEQRTGLSDLYIEQVRAFSELGRHPLGRVISIAYYALIKIKNYEIKDSENKQLQWVPLSKISELAFDHNKILNDCYAQLKRRLRERPIGFSLLPKKFTLIQLQKLYEIILGLELDKRNFRRKLQSTGLLIDLNENQTDVSHRPAKLFSFDYEEYRKKKTFQSISFDI
ncbi:MAG: NUDIX domain-containing protein [Saprospiraceae bacterium]|nr:NUDIX domain-containing protein [Bacteroidia bacterium]NNE13938.1 NUDIX domain-containing protein [Saprospiraceae bacterium]NNL91618.1 NUDIX domain-containing protein [Saprospiraceae bacterium]